MTDDDALGSARDPGSGAEPYTPDQRDGAGAHRVPPYVSNGFGGRYIPPFPVDTEVP